MRNFTQEEAKVIYKDAQSKGLDPNKVMSQLVLKGATFDGIDMAQAKQYAQSQIPKTETSTSFMDRAKETLGDVTGIVKDIGESSSKRAENIQTSEQAYKSGEQGFIQTKLQQAGQLAGAGADAIGAVFKGAGNVLLSDKHEKDVSEIIGKFGAKVMAIPQVQNIINSYNELPPEKQRDIDAVGGVVSLVTNFVGGEVAGRGAEIAKTGIKTGAEAVATGVKTGAEAVATGAKKVVTSPAVAGTVQFGKDVVGRVPTAVKRGVNAFEESAIKAGKIKASTPAVQKAYKTNLDERIINTVNEADSATKQAYKQVIDIAEETPKTVGLKKQPSIVGGDLASKQYDIINAQKKSIGEKIGEVTKNLSKTTKINMQDSFGQIDDTLASQGIIPQYTKKGVKLDFTGSKYTPAQRTKIQQLYDLATEGGDNLSPSQIKGKDQLFSQLKRESNFEGIGDLIIETPDGAKSMFSVFRDIYSSKLDGISPEIRALNAQYRKLSNITDDIEDSIFKTPNFNATKSVDPAEFAKVNMRRIFGEAGSSPAFEAVANNMDTLARELGYKGATPKQVAEFAEYIRKLYPETVPKTGFQGGIKAGVSDVIEAVSKIGAPNLKDQREALKGLFDDYLKSSKSLKGKGTIPENSPRKIEPDLTLKGEDAKIQDASISKYKSNPQKLTQDYIRTNGKVVNTDEARKLFKDVGYKGSNSPAVQEASSAVAKDVWEELLKTSKANDSLIYAGGSGTGKTSAVKNIFPQDIADAGAILDGNLSTMKSAGARIQESIKAGKYPTIVYVYRDPVDAWVNGVIKRMKSNVEEGGRVVPLSVFLENHKGSYEVVKNLLNDTSNGIRYDVKMVDNSLGKGRQALLDRSKFDTIKYQDNLKQELLNQTKKLYDKGTINKTEYEALIK